MQTSVSSSLCVVRCQSEAMSHDTWTVSIPFPVAVDRSQLQIHPSSAVRSRLQPGGRPLPGWVTCAFGFLQLLLVAWHLIWLVNVGTGMGWFGGGSMGRISNSLALGMSVWLAPQSTSKYLETLETRPRFIAGQPFHARARRASRTATHRRMH